jgi:hypothetical protein
MQKHHSRLPLWYDPLEDQDTADRQTASLGGVAIALLLIVVGLFLIQELHAKVQIEDCLLSGRSNCGVLVSSSR